MSTLEEIIARYVADPGWIQGGFYVWLISEVERLQIRVRELETALAKEQQAYTDLATCIREVD